jgi:DUF438 domain-containing protein
MEDLKVLSGILDTLAFPLVFVDTEHIVRYINAEARQRYARLGVTVGKSIFACHNEHSSEIIRLCFQQLEHGENDIFMYENKKHRSYMRAIRDEKAALLGYYERFEPPAKNDRP